jgi:hypothetical protein
MVLAVRRLIAALDRPVDAASLAFFRIAFGLAMGVLALRFFTHGWIDADYRVPTHFFHYWGVSWIAPWSGDLMYVHYAVIGLSALAIAVGFAYRLACAVFAVTFSYAHLCDKSNYLNHYYLVSLLAFLMVLLPLDREASLRVLRRPGDRLPEVRAWALLVLRFQIGVVYLFGGIAKIGTDWLVYGEPLRIWLAANVELPLVGRLLVLPWVALAASWCGMLFDLSIVPLLSWRRTRRPAYVVLVVFHVSTAVLFKIGMFPWIMMVSATLFFEPSWPRAVFARVFPRSPCEGVAGRPISWGALAAGAVYATIQLLVPLRHVLYPGNTLWTEEGFRYSWKVMLIEKSAELELNVVDDRGARTLVEPRAYLTPFQARMASTQPDMILELAHIVAQDFERRGRGHVRVFAEARVSFNGRPGALLVSPTVDLAAERDTLAPKRWILPAPQGAPEF